MPRYEYKVLPAPPKGTKAKGIKTPEGRFALSIEQLLNQMGASGWEYQRAELLPSDERSGLTGTTVNWRNVLVFRRTLDSVSVPIDEVQDDATPQEDDEPAPAPEPPLAPISQPVEDPPLTSEQSKDAVEAMQEDESETTPVLSAALKTRAEQVSPKPPVIEKDGEESDRS
ncbi:DUF4177 domain-containing protein [Phaeobacter gallaeciensis]|uniref:DUF4177 domain-containing protein n=1 Tax=Phaeobacter gallaeciensis TaxID=60890 RepID=A0A366WMU8_9RHOB|nr:MULTISPECIES: DUF4177 domain-containing protein [Roseobacteraceae]MBT8166911.1 DUF4177 domain-containing protein [Falsiruegeria litorea]RBW51518.1 DUF4177 domain-containing protein [Phaeobacter gallaeciensis]